MINVICYSGGKDATALWLWARRKGIAPRRIIFADTGWEHPETISYIDQIEALMGEPITRVRGPETFEGRVRRLRGFPSSGRRWCTDELKIQPTARELDRMRDETGDEIQELVGARAEESRARAALAPWRGGAQRDRGTGSSGAARPGRGGALWPARPLFWGGGGGGVVCGPCINA